VAKPGPGPRGRGLTSPARRPRGQEGRAASTRARTWATAWRRTPPPWPAWP